MLTGMPEVVARTLDFNCSNTLFASVETSALLCLRSLLTSSPNPVSRSWLGVISGTNGCSCCKADKRRGASGRSSCCRILVSSIASRAVCAAVVGLIAEPLGLLSATGAAADDEMGLVDDMAAGVIRSSSSVCAVADYCVGMCMMVSREGVDAGRVVSAI